MTTISHVVNIFLFWYTWSVNQKHMKTFFHLFFFIPFHVLTWVCSCLNQRSLLIHPTCFNLSRLNRMFSIYTSSSLCYLFSQWLILLMFLFRLFWIMSATFIALFCVLNTLAVLSNGPVDRTVLASDDSYTTESIMSFLVKRKFDHFIWHQDLIICPCSDR